MLFSENRLWINNLDLEFPVLHGSDDDGWRYGERNALRRSNRDEGKREKQREKRGPPTMSNIAGLFHPWEREPERGVAHRGGSRRGLETRESREGVQRREEHRSISVPPPSPFRHSHFSPRSALHHSASHPPSFVPLSFLLPLCLWNGATLPSSFRERRRRAGRCFPTLKTSLPACATDCSFRIHYRGPCQRFARV